jgi:ribonuclease T1
MVRSGAFKLALTGVLLASAVWWTGLQAKEVLPAYRGSVVAFNSLPAQGQETYQLIRQGGPFPYEKDGVVFGNRERLLPQQKRGFYREYTVKTPGSGDRGARRIVCGGEVKTPRTCYYSDDHYASFRKIVP